MSAAPRPGAAAGATRAERRIARAAAQVPVAPRVAAPLALMALIFFLSAQPDLSTGLGLADLIGRKIAHAAVFGGLCLLWFWTLSPHLGPVAALALAAAVSLAYATSDELHQSFVAGRSGSPVDVAIDLAGILAAALWVRRLARARP